MLDAKGQIGSGINLEQRPKNKRQTCEFISETRPLLPDEAHNLHSTLLLSHFSGTIIKLFNVLSLYINIKQIQCILFNI